MTLQRRVGWQRLAGLVLSMALLAAAGCGDRNNGTLLVVNVATTLTAADYDRIDIEAAAAGGPVQKTSFSASAVPTKFAVVPQGDPNVQVHILAQAMRGTTAVVTLIADIDLLSGKPITTTLLLSRDCLGGGGCTAPLVCVAGPRCVDTTAVAEVNHYDPSNPDAAVTPDANGAIDVRVDIDAPGGNPDTASPDVARDAGIDQRSIEAGEAGQTLGTWMKVDSLLTNGSFSSVWPVSEKDVWVVGTGGVSAGGGIAHHWDGQAFTATILPVGTRALFGVWATAGGDEAWAVGTNGTIVRWMRGAWTAVAIPGGDSVDLAAVWGSAANDVWIVGRNRTVLHWNGMVLVRTANGVLGDLSSVAGNAAGDRWAVGAGGAVYRGSGDSWMVQQPGLGNNLLFSVWVGDREVWAVGQAVALHFDGSRWTNETGTPQTTLAVWGAAENDVWAVGNQPSSGGQQAQGLIRHWDGFTWGAVPMPAVRILQSVHGLNSRDVWAVGQDGAILRYR